MNTRKIRDIFHKLALITGIILGAFTVANVFADTPPELPDLSGECTDEETMVCTGEGETCRIICESSEWTLCSAVNKGNTVIDDKYICSPTTYWIECEASNDGTIIEGKICTSDQWQISGPPEIGMGAICGNGATESGETCDDGNIVNGDGCSSTCQEEPPGMGIGSICGNGVINPGETCDDGNIVNGDGCSSTCQEEPPGMGILTCGNGVLNAGEQCDSVEHCTSCQCNAGYEPESEIANACVQIDASTCGNDELDAGEECDGGTSCDDECQCTGTKVSDSASDPPGCKTATPANLCGNGTRDSGEQCDKSGGQNCNNSCQCNAGFIPVSGTSINCKSQTTDPPPSTKQCNDNIDNDSDGKKDYPADPGCESATDNSEADPPAGTLTITEAEVFPVGFNPTMAETKISYKISGNGFIKLDILDESGAKIVTLVNNEEVEGNKLKHVTWNGKDKVGSKGKIVEPGKYFFKLMVKSSASAAASDTKTGAINIIYSADFEDADDNVGAAGNSGSNIKASVNNVPIKETSGTGPETAIYLIFPVAGYLLLRKRIR